MEAVGAHRGNVAPTRRRRRRFTTVFCRRRQLPVMKYGATVFTSLRGSRGGCRATRWGSGAHRAVARHEGGWCGDALRQRRCFGGRPWLEEGPAAPNEGGDSEGGSKSKQCRVVVVAIRSLPVSSSTTTWTRCRLKCLGGDNARFWWLLCDEEGGVGEKCSTAPRAEAEEKLGEEMLGAHQLKGGGGVRYSVI
jgi:hypothetical protein